MLSPEQLVRRLHPAFYPAGRPLPRWPLAERMARYRVPGVGLAFVAGGEPAWTASFGRLHALEEQPVDADTLFQAASISKPVTALAALRLAARGLLDLDAGVRPRLRRWALPPGPPVSLRRLLAHHAGVNVPGFRGYASGEAVPDLVQVLSGESPANSPAVRVEAEPGSRTAYSGGGYTLVQLLLEDVTGTPFPDLLAELVFEPLGMSGSAFRQPLPAAEAARAAAGHRLRGEPVVGRWHVYPELAAAGLWSTPGDLARFAAGVARAWAGRLPELLPQELAREMLRPLAGERGLGFEVHPEEEGGPRFGHTGSNQGYRARLEFYAARGEGLVVMTNADGGHNLALEITRAAAELLGWPAFRPRKRRAARLAPAALRRLAGRYALREYPDELIEVRALGSRLSFGWNDDPRRQHLLPASPQRFFSLESALELDFRPAGGADLEISGLGPEPEYALRVS